MAVVVPPAVLGYASGPRLYKPASAVGLLWPRVSYRQREGFLGLYSEPAEWSIMPPCAQAGRLPLLSTARRLASQPLLLHGTTRDDQTYDELLALAGW